MSKTYTHKIILFSEDSFKGDALVVMAINKGESISSLKEIRYKDINNNGKTFDDATYSLIVERGSWELHYNGLDSISEKYERKNTDNSCFKKENYVDRAGRRFSSMHANKIPN